MRVVNIHEAKTHLSRLIRDVIDGEEIVIARANRPLVKLVLVDSARIERILGSAAGSVRMSDDFDAPLDEFSNYS